MTGAVMVIFTLSAGAPALASGPPTAPDHAAKLVPPSDGVEPGPPASSEQTKAPQSASPAKTRVVILDPRMDTEALALATPMSQALASAFDGHDDHQVVSLTELRSAAAYAELGEALQCAGSEACLAALATKLDADWVVSSTVGKVGDSYSINVVVLAPETAAVKGRAFREATDEAQLLTSVPKLVAEVMGWSAPENTVRFQLPEGQKLSFAVMPLASTGVGESETRNLTELLATELKRVDGVSVLGFADVEAVLNLEGERANLGCSNDNSCLAEIGGALGVDKLVSGEVGKVGDRYIIGLRLVDREAVSVESRVSETFTGPEAQLVRAVRRAARRLVGVQSDAPGQLSVSTNRNGASVFVDGERRGTAPGPPIENLAPGRHLIRVAANGFYEWQGDIYVDAEETTAHWVELEEEPQIIRAFLPAWSFWVGVGTVVVAAVLTAGVGALAAGAVTLYNIQRQGDENKYVDGAELKTTYNAALVALVASSSGAVMTAVLAGGVALSSLVVEWEAE